jgi:hypothetical protein
MKNLKRFEAFNSIVTDEDFIALHKDKTVDELVKLNISFDKICYLKNSIDSDLVVLMDLKSIYPNNDILNAKKKNLQYQVGNKPSVFNFVPNAKSHEVIMNTYYSSNVNIFENLEGLGWKVENLLKNEKTAVLKEYYTVIMSKQTYLIQFFVQTIVEDISTTVYCLNKILY